MASGGRLLFLAKWIVAPAALGVLLFFTVGPKLGERAFVPVSRATATPSDDASSSDPSTIDGSAAADYPTPAVKIEAHTMSETPAPTEPKPRRHRKRRRKPRTVHKSSPPADTPPAIETPPPDSTPPPGKADDPG